MTRARRHALQAFLRDHYNAISTSELEELGFSGGAITRLGHDGWIERQTRGIYTGRGGPEMLETTLRCCLLRQGPTSALTRRSAAHFLGHLRFAPTIPQIVVPGQSGFEPRHDFERHGGNNYGPGDLITHRSLRTTSPFRTIVDLAADAAAAAGEASRWAEADARNISHSNPQKTATARAHADGCRRVLRWALRSAANEDDTLADRLRRTVSERAPFPGSAMLATQLGGSFERTQTIRSNVEDRFLELCARFGLPTPETNAVVHGIELDAWFAEYEKYVEIDTYATHGNEVAFARDQANAATLARHQIYGIHVNDQRIDHDDVAVAADVRGLLGL